MTRHPQPRAWTEFISESEVALRFGRSVKTIKRWVQSGRLVAHEDPSGARWYHPDDLAEVFKKAS